MFPLIGQLLGFDEKTRERRCASEDFAHTLQEPRRACVLLGERSDHHEILSLQVFDKGMGRVHARGWPLIRFAPEGPGLFERRRGKDALPCRGILDNRLADPGECLRIRMPKAHGNEHLARPEMDIEPGRMHVRGCLMPEVRGCRGLVGALVGREARVPVDPEERSAHGPGIGPEMAADRAKGRGKVSDEAEHGVPQVLFIALFIRLEPFTVVVLFKLFEEPEQLRSEIGLGSHWQSSYPEQTHSRLIFALTIPRLRTYRPIITREATGATAAAIVSGSSGFPRHALTPGCSRTRLKH